MPREAIASKIEIAEQIAATYSRIHSTFCQNNTDIKPNLNSQFPIGLALNLPTGTELCKIQTAEQIAATYSQNISTFCQYIPAGAKENM